MTTTLVTPEVDVSIIDIKDGPNTRKRLDPEALKGLTSNIKSIGVVQPIVIEPAPEGRYFVVAGRRRLTAAKAAGLKQIPVKMHDDERTQTPQASPRTPTRSPAA